MRRSTWSNYTLATFLVVFASMPFPGVIVADVSISTLYASGTTQLLPTAE